MKVRHLLLTIIIFLFSTPTEATVKTTVNSGNWTTANTWSPAGVPTSTDEVVIKSGHNPIINTNGANCKSLTIQQNATINITSGRKINIHSTDGINLQGKLLVDQGELEILSPLTNLIIGATGQLTWNPGNNTEAGASLFTNSKEQISPSATIIFKKWYDIRKGLGEVISGNLGNITIMNINGWKMNNSLQSHKILGELKLTSAHVVLDTTGAITQTTIGSIQLTNTSSILDFYHGNQTINYTVQTGNLSIAGGELDINIGTGSGNCSLIVDNNIDITNYGYLIGASGSDVNIHLSVGGNFTITRSYFMGIRSGSGNATIHIKGNLTTLKCGTTYSEFYGIVDGNGNTEITINGNFNNQGYSTLIWNTGATGVGNGHASLTIDGEFTQSDGDFRGTWNATTFNAGRCAISIDSLLFTGGIFMGTYSCSNSTDTIILNFGHLCSIRFNNTGDIFRGVGMATLSGTPNTQRMRFTAFGNFEISGNASAEFSSSFGYGNEINLLQGSINISGGTNKFGGSSHFTSLETGDVLINGGNTTLSDNSGPAFIMMKSFCQKGGLFNLKNNIGSCILNIQNNFTQSEGTLYLYSNSTINNTDTVLIRTTGDFTQTGGIFSFSRNAIQTGQTILNLECEKYSIGGNGIITSAGAGTAIHFGIIQITGGGLSREITINSTSNTHLTEQAKYHISSLARVKLTGEHFRISSHQTTQHDMLLSEPNSELDAGTTVIESNAQFSNCGITIRGNISTRHVNGLFDGSENATISAKSGMDYYLDQNSKVTYNGTGQQIISGYGYGNKSGEQHKYGTLAIDGHELTLRLNKNVIARQSTELRQGDIDLNNFSFYCGDLIDMEHEGGFIFDQNQSVIKSRVIIGKSAPYGTGFNHVLLPIRDPSLGIITVRINSTSNQLNSLLSFSTRSTPPNNQPLPGADHVAAIANLNPGGEDIAITKTIDRYFEINADGITANYSLFYLGRENTTANTVCKGNIIVRNWNGSSWKNITSNSYGDTVTTKHYPVEFQASNLKGPILFRINESANTGSLLNWQAVAETKGNKCSWETTAGKEYEHFIIERSTDLQNFIEIGKVNAGTTNGNVRNYTFYDQNPPENIGYYRLKQVDKNGLFEYSTTIQLNRQSVTANDAAQLLVSNIFPNPFHDQFTIEYTLENAGTVSFRILNMRGQVLANKESEGQAGANTITFSNLDQLPGGTYLLHVIKGTEMITRKLTKTTN